MNSVEDAIAQRLCRRQVLLRRGANARDTAQAPVVVDLGRGRTRSRASARSSAGRPRGGTADPTRVSPTRKAWFGQPRLRRREVGGARRHLEGVAVPLEDALDLREVSEQRVARWRPRSWSPRTSRSRARRAADVRAHRRGRAAARRGRCRAPARPRRSPRGSPPSWRRCGCRSIGPRSSARRARPARRSRARRAPRADRGRSSRSGCAPPFAQQRVDVAERFGGDVLEDEQLGHGPGGRVASRGTARQTAIAARGPLPAEQYAALG